MKKIILLFALISSTICSAQVWRHDINVRQYFDKNTGKYVNIETQDSTFQMPEWQSFKDDITSNVIFLQLMPGANPNGYSTFIDYINSGIDGKHDTGRFLLYWGLMGLNLTTDQKSTINAILTKNYFAIQL